MGMNANGTVKPSDLKADNVTWFNAKELVATLDSITRHQAAAVMGSLGRKGLAMEPIRRKTKWKNVQSG